MYCGPAVTWGLGKENPTASPLQCFVGSTCPHFMGKKWKHRELQIPQWISREEQGQEETVKELLKLGPSKASLRREHWAEAWHTRESQAKRVPRRGHSKCKGPETCLTLSRNSKEPMGLEPNQSKRPGGVREWGRWKERGGESCEWQVGSVRAHRASCRVTNCPGLA